MAFTDFEIDGAVFPQDAGWSGIGNSTADWANSAFIGGLALANGNDYAPFGLDFNPDFTNDTIQVLGGLAFIKDNTDILYREFSDSEQQLNGTWSQPFLVAIQTKDTANLAMQAPSGVNHIWLYYTHNTQNAVEIRIADTDADTPSDPNLKLGTVDAGANESTLVNREGISGGGDRAWTFLGSGGTGGSDVSTADITVPDPSFDQFKIEFEDVGGTSTASGSGSVLFWRVNNVQSGYNFRTVGNTNRRKSKVKVAQGKASRMSMGGSLFVDTVGNEFTFDNRTTGNEEKQYAFSGANINPSSVLPMSSVQFFWSNGRINGTWNFYGRDKI
jgi:hypothetical protein